MLDAAGVDHQIIAATVDENAVKANSPDASTTALELAAAKALDVSVACPADWIIGSDSIASVDGRMFDKPATRDQAADHLRSFSGRRLQLTSAVALASGGTVDWHHVESAALHVRSLSEAFIDAYLDAEWPEVGHCVGVFRLEGRGVQLFDRIEGDYFTILGMPLLSLLGALRDRGLLLA
jgi:septum formation protein